MNSFGNDDFYLFYKKRYNGKLNRKMFLRILSKLFLKMREELYKGNIVILPFKLGSYYILRYKPKLKQDKNGNYYVAGHRTVDFKSTKELWNTNPQLKKEKRLVYYENKHSDGTSVKLKRTKFGSSFLQKIYNFKPVQSFRDGLCKTMFEDPHREFITQID